MESKSTKISLLASILNQRRYFTTAIIVFILYALVYLIATKYLIFTTATGEAGGVVEILPNWQQLMFKQRSTFLFEPIGILRFGQFASLFLSLPNLLIAALLGFLVAVNIAVSYYSFKALALSGASGIASLVGTIPAIISGAACCVPTLILVLGLQLTATLATLWSFFVPVSLILLLASLWWALHKIAIKKL